LEYRSKRMIECRWFAISGKLAFERHSRVCAFFTGRKLIIASLILGLSHARTVDGSISPSCCFVLEVEEVEAEETDTDATDDLRLSLTRAGQSVWCHSLQGWLLYFRAAVDHIKATVYDTTLTCLPMEKIASMESMLLTLNNDVDHNYFNAFSLMFWHSFDLILGR
jgi:hypothetical protein